MLIHNGARPATHAASEHASEYLDTETVVRQKDRMLGNLAEVDCNFMTRYPAKYLGVDAIVKYGMTTIQMPSMLSASPRTPHMSTKIVTAWLIEAFVACMGQGPAQGLPLADAAVLAEHRQA